MLSILHLAVDGAGAAAVGHVLGASLYGQPTALPVGAHRDLASVLERVRWFHLPQLARDTAGLLVQSARTFAAGKRERAYPRTTAQPSERDDRPSWRHLVVSAADAERIKASCQARGASLNDALVAALARVAAARSSGDAVSVIYTMDLRRYRRTPRLSAANTSSILSVVVPRSVMGDLASTAAAVAARTRRHKRGLTGPALLLGAAALSTGAPHALVRLLIPGCTRRWSTCRSAGACS